MKNASVTAIEGRGVQSVEVGARILDAMVEIGAPAMLRDIASQANITSAQAHAYLVSFRKVGLVEQNAANGRYLLGPFALQLGLSRLRQVDPLRIASAAVDELAAELGLMVTLSVWGTHGPTIVQVQESQAPLHVNLRAGAVYTMTGTATGILYAAYLPDRVVRPLIDAELRAGSQNRAIGSPTSLRSLTSAASAVRALGYSTTAGSPVPGINAIAAPVFDHTGQLQCALTVIGAEAAVDVTAGSSLAVQVHAFAQALSTKLGFRGAEEASAQPPSERPRASRQRAVRASADLQD